MNDDTLNMDQAQELLKTVGRRGSSDDWLRETIAALSQARREGYDEGIEDSIQGIKEVEELGVGNLSRRKIHRVTNVCIGILHHMKVGSG